MFKNLSPKALGISGRQSELIELALTYGFRGLDVDMADLAKRAKVHGVSQAVRFVESAKIRVGGFDLPVNLRADDAAFQTQVAQLNDVCEVAASVKAQRCLVHVAPTSEDQSFQANFELHRQRLGKVADVLAKHSIRLGVGFYAAPALREGKPLTFIYQTETLLTLVKTVGAKNVGVLVDTWNWFVGGGNLDQIRELNPDQIVAVRLADYPADANLERIVENQRMLPQEEGAVDCSAIVTHLAKKLYDGPVTLYPHPTAFRGSTRESIVQKAAHALEEMWKAAGLSKAKLAIAPAASAAVAEG